MKKIRNMFVSLFAVSVILIANSAIAKPSPKEVLVMLQKGNERFVAGKCIHPSIDGKRLQQAGSESQGDHAYATVITCSDSRVPVELLFDAGVMDIFVVRVAGNVCKTDEAGSIEYGLCHVHTPVLVVLGHTQCGAVSAVTHEVLGVGHALERNIPPLVAPIIPAVKCAMKKYPNLHGDAIIPHAIVENVWQGVKDLFMVSPATRALVKSGKVKVVGAIYDVGTGKVKWMPESRTMQILAEVETNPARAMNAMAHHSGKKGKEARALQAHIVCASAPVADKWEPTIKRFEEHDKKNPPQKNIVLAVGSSSFTNWKTMKDDLKPYPLTNRGFGGSTFWNIHKYFNRLVPSHEPKVILVYEGDNDLNSARNKAEMVFENFKKFVDRVHKLFPQTKIIFVSIKHSIKREKRWPEMNKANELIKNYVKDTPKLSYVDINKVMKGADGQPDKKYFSKDMLHLNKEGYAKWAAVIKEELKKQWTTPAK